MCHDAADDVSPKLSVWLSTFSSLDVENPFDSAADVSSDIFSSSARDDTAAEAFDETTEETADEASDDIIEPACEETAEEAAEEFSVDAAEETSEDKFDEADEEAGEELSTPGFEDVGILPEKITPASMRAPGAACGRAAGEERCG